MPQLRYVEGNKKIDVELCYDIALDGGRLLSKSAKDKLKSYLNDDYMLKMFAQIVITRIFTKPKWPGE